MPKTDTTTDKEDRYSPDRYGSPYADGHPSDPNYPGGGYPPGAGPYYPETNAFPPPPGAMYEAHNTVPAPYNPADYGPAAEYMPAEYGPAEYPPEGPAPPLVPPEAQYQQEAPYFPPPPREAAPEPEPEQLYYDPRYLRGDDNVSAPSAPEHAYRGGSTASGGIG